MPVTWPHAGVMSSRTAPFIEKCSPLLGRHFLSTKRNGRLYFWEKQREEKHFVEKKR